MLGTLLLCGVAVVGLHGLALTRATRPLRLESLRAVSDSLARDPESVGRLPSRTLHAVLLDERGQRLRGDPLPLWLPAAAPRSPDGEHCARLGAPCWAVRRTRYAGSPATVVAYYSLDPELVSPLSVALVGSLGLGVLASAGAGSSAGPGSGAGLACGRGASRSAPCSPLSVASVTRVPSIVICRTSRLFSR